MHQAMVRMDGEKMSKSLGNLVFVSELRKAWDSRAIRLAVLAHHYRHEWDWDDDVMPDATHRLKRWQAAAGGEGAGTGQPVLEAVRAALDDDLDTPERPASARRGGRRRPGGHCGSRTDRRGPHPALSGDPRQ